VENDISDLCARGVRCLAVARTDPLGDWVFLGLLTFLDPPRPDTLQTILDSKKYGVAVKMITGTRSLLPAAPACLYGPEHPLTKLYSFRARSRCYPR
jgi:hypothetical protein